MKRQKSQRSKKQVVVAAIYMSVAITVVFLTSKSIGSIINGGDAEKQQELNSGFTKNEDISKLDIPRLDENILFIEENFEKDESNSIHNKAETESGSEHNLPENLSEIQSGIKNEIMGKDESKAENVSGIMENVTSEIEYPTDPESYSLEGQYIKPADGYICREYSPDTLIYSQTMFDYRTHNGVDYAADAGSAVRAFSNGIVEKIYNDPMFGTCIEISHEDGIVSVYRNLYEEIPVGIDVGSTVNAGDIIGGVGETALCESADVPHLHFELIKDGKNSDPSEYFD